MIVRIPGILGKPDFIYIFENDLIEKVLRTEGKYPTCFSIAALAKYRRQEPFFNGVGGLLIEHGEKWHQIRSKVNPILLQPDVYRSFLYP